MILKRSGDTFTFEFNEHDLVALTRNLMNREVRGVVYHTQLRKVVGRINYYTMQFKLIDREAAGLAPIELGEETQVFLECN